MRIAHFSDPHAGGVAEDWLAYFDKRWVGVFNYRFRRQYQHDLKFLDKAIDYILTADVDLVVCTGDLTSTGQPGEFNVVRPYMERLRQSSIPVIYLPGNHDCYVKRKKCVTAMQEMVKFANKDVFEFKELPLVQDYDQCEVILVNSSYPSNLLCSWGFISKKDSDFVVDYCRNTPKSKPRILVTHYPMLEERSLRRIRHGLFGGNAIRKLLDDKVIDLALCGHVHKPYLIVDDNGRGENCAGSVTKNGSFTMIDFDPGRDTFSFETVNLDR